MSFGRHFLVLALIVPIAAQTEATITGTVRDASGAGLPSASIAIKNVETGATRRIIADPEGRYAAPALTIGRYELSADLTGFAQETKTGITLVIGQQINVDFTPKIGELKEAVKVEETITPVNLPTQQTSGLVGEQQVKDLPLNGRSYDELLSLNPSIVNYSNGGSGA